jgi:glycosyltransferase involved in cell wall biosynthesis
MRLTIILPVRNEGLNLKIMLKILRATVEVEHEVLVVCDTADDASVPVVKAARHEYPNARVVINDLGRGVVNAIRAGVRAADGDVILIFAADEVGPVLAIEDMLVLINNGCDFVSCTRYAHGGRRLGGSVVGGILSRGANRLFHRLGGSALTDATTGIKMFRKEVFAKIDPQSRPVGWAVAFEMSIKAELLGLKLGEVPIISIDRLFGGASSFKVGAWTWEYLYWFMWGARRSIRGPKPPVAVRVPLATAGATVVTEDDIWPKPRATPLPPIGPRRSRQRQELES